MRLTLPYGFPWSREEYQCQWDTHFYPKNETYYTEGRRRLFSGGKKESSIPGLFYGVQFGTKLNNYILIL